MDKNKVIKKLIKAKARKYILNPAIVFGICIQESKLNPDAARYEAKYRWLVRDSRLRPSGCSPATEMAFQKTSWGLMQVMGGVLREQGFPGWLNAITNSPELQLEYGCRQLAKKMRRYGIIEGILAYNTGSPRRDKSGKYVNQDYFNRVIHHSHKW